MEFNNLELTDLYHALGYAIDRYSKHISDPSTPEEHKDAFSKAIDRNNALRDRLDQESVRMHQENMN